ncbi:endonuclease/exonuclease/phosphatase family protein [Fodinicola acaciae]|uniref:endonuclease/exonuclease/phosphatase family protein n=1 Tax=Fodinicola acaciae TaxID=2681555 RepID=UPI0013D7844D|nr:endonuclease/exonuclease/phosphatase family protein [Fodinicola acaciae]
MPRWPYAVMLVAVAVFTSLLTTGSAATASGGLPVRGDQLHVMTFNLRYASTTTPNSWAERRPVMASLLRRERPHLIGTQEGLFEQLNDIGDDLGSSYRSLGLGREGGSNGEFMMIFYDSRRLRVMAYDHYWLSDTPLVMGSKTWGGCCARMVTWARFLDRRTHKQFYAINSHFEAFDAVARSKAADLVLQREAQLDPKLPVIMTADFNEAGKPGETVYDKLVTNGPFRDSWVTAARRSPLYATFHGYRPLVPDGDRIDWILTSPGITTSAALINTYQRGGQYPSDHLPVQSAITLH